jgi:hypothetical protein
VSEPQPPVGWPFGKKAKHVARIRLRDLIRAERQRARLHIHLIKQSEPIASPDRIALVILDRWKTAAAVEGGVTGAFGLLGVPLNFLLFAYFQLAAVVSIAEVYGIELEGEAGEDALLSVVGRAHGMEDVVRASPRVLGAVAKALAMHYGLGIVGRLIPLAAAPISAKLNERDMARVGGEALRRFGNVLSIE